MGRMKTECQWSATKGWHILAIAAKRRHPQDGGRSRHFTNTDQAYSIVCDSSNKETTIFRDEEKAWEK